MDNFSCIVNFRDNFTKNTAKYISLLSKMTQSKNSNYRIDEHSAFCADKSFEIIQKISEGYEFTAIFGGYLNKSAQLREKLSGYGFLTSSDAETALTAYIHYGAKCISELRGNFFLAVYDFMRRSAFVFTTGVPVFYRSGDDTVLISSHPSAMFNLYPPKVTRDKLRELFATPKNPPACVFDGTEFLSPGYALMIRPDFIEKLHVTDPCPADIPVGLRETAQKVADIASENIPVSNTAGIILGGSTADNAVLSLVADKTKFPCTYSFDYENIQAEALKCYRSHIPLSENDLRFGLETSVLSCGIPLYSREDFFIPIYLKQIPEIRCRIFCGNISCGTKPLCGELLKNRLLLPSTVRTLELSENEPHTDRCAPLLNMLAAETGMSVISPFSDSEIRCIFNSVPYTEESVYAEILRLKSGIVPLPKTPPDRTEMLKHILLEILVDDDAPILAFFDKSALLRVCEGRIFVPPEIIAYIVKINIWFSKYKPRLI